MARRGTSVRVLGLSKSLQVKYRRAVALSGARSQSQHLLSMIRRAILEAEQKHGDLLHALTPEEQDVLGVIEAGAAEVSQIAEETLLTVRRVEQVLDELIGRGLVESRRKGGKTESARGAVIKLYFLAENKTIRLI
ncbi:MAG: MarR family transcriptional regulator [Acidobacteria bacterium]|nr:MarR family transcriptional regulator [Acidobacteriota bacterium]